MTNLTCVSPFVPHPGVLHAGGLFLHHYLVGMSRTLSIRLVAPSTPQNIEALSACDPAISVHLFRVPARGGDLVSRSYSHARFIADGLTPGLHVLRAFCADPVVDSLLRESDAVEVEWSEYLPLVPHIRSVTPRARLGALVLDVVTQGLGRRARSSASLVGRVGAGIKWLRVRRQEPALLNRCDVVFVFKDPDRELLQGLGVDRPIQLFEPFLDPPVPPIGPSRKPTVLFTGALFRPENWEGVRWCLDRVWPLVLAEQPQAQFIIAGAGAPPTLRDSRDRNVTLTGTVDDLGPYYRMARVFVAPLRTGAGIKFKVAQAMLHGLPVVATRLAVEGISPPAPEATVGAVADDPRDIAREILRFLKDDGVAEAVGASGHAWAGKTYSFQRNIDAALAHYSGAMATT